MKDDENFMLATKLLIEKNHLADLNDSGLQTQNAKIFINPLNAYILKDTGLSRIKKTLNNPELTPDIMISDISEYLKNHKQNELYSKFDKFLNLVIKHTGSKAREILFYCHELIINNFSGFSHEQINSIFAKLTDMLNSVYDERAGTPVLIVLSSLRDLAIPSSVSQQELNSCSITCIQTQLAIREPLEYLNIIDSLAQNKTYFSLRKQLINPDWSFLESKNDSRTITCKLFQNAIFNLCNPDKKTFGKSGINGGLTSDLTLKVYKILFSEVFRIYENSDYTPEQMLEILKNSNPTKSNPVQISIHYTARDIYSLHAVNVINYDNRLQDIRIINPWGREEIIDFGVFKSRISFIICQEYCDKKIPRIPQQFFNIVLESNKMPWYLRYFTSNKMEGSFIDEKLTKYLDCLNLDQKIDLIISIYSNRVRKKEKILILKILNNIFQGSDYQNKTVLEALFLKFTTKNILFLYFINTLEINDLLFENVVQKIYRTNSQCGQMLWEMLNEDFWELNY